MTEIRPFDVDRSFAADYRTARTLFLTAARAAGAALTSITHSDNGPAGEAMAIDLAWFGPADAERVLVLVSGTNGVTGFCGSGAQVDWMAGGGPAALPTGVAALVVHALNPYGFAWLRRVTVNGVDLNRNGIDFSLPPPANRDYATLAHAFVPADLEPRTLAEADTVLQRFADVHGARALAHAGFAGQYTHPDGIFYGGREPCWSMRMLSEICRDFRLAARAGVAIIDYPTGLGPHGHGEPVVGHRPGTSGQARCRAWYGDSLGEPLLGSSSSIPVAGLCQNAWEREIGAEVLTFVALQFGTYPLERRHAVIRGEQVAHRMGLAWDDPRLVRAKADLRDFYYPTMRTWREIVLFRSQQVIGQALAGLTGEPGRTAR